MYNIKYEIIHSVAIYISIIQYYQKSRITIHLIRTSYAVAQIRIQRQEIITFFSIHKAQRNKTKPVKSFSCHRGTHTHTQRPYGLMTRTGYYTRQ